MATNTTPTPEQIEEMRQKVANYDAEKAAADKAARNEKVVALKVITDSAEYTKVLKDLKTLQNTIGGPSDVSIQVMNTVTVLDLLKNLS